MGMKWCFILACLCSSAVRAANPEVLTTVAEAIAYAESHEHADVPFRFSGIVCSGTQASIVPYSLTFQDNTGKTTLHNIDPKVNVRRGDLISVSGSFQLGNFRQPLFQTKDIVVTGHETPPAAIDINGCDIARPDLINTFVRVRGVIASASPDVQDARFNWMDLRTSSGLVRVAIYRQLESIESLRKLVDAEVFVEGFPIPPSNWRRHLANVLGVNTPGAITVQKSPPSDPMSAPVFHTQRELHRQRIEGTVLARTRSELFISTDIQSCLRVRLAEPAALPPPGMVVTVSGFFESDPLNLQIVGAYIHPSARTLPLPEPSDADIKTILTRANDINQTDPVFSGCLLRLRGIVQLPPEESRENTSTTILSQGHALSVDLDGIGAEDLAKFEDGNEIEMVALFLPQFNSVKSAPEFLQLRNFIAIPRLSSEITVLRRPSWWTTGRLMIVIGALTIVILGTLVWNMLLRKISERRGRELAASAIAKTESDLKVFERTRLAVELHDSIAQSLTGVSLAIRGHNLPLAEMTLDSCREDLRNCIWDLRNLTLDDDDINEAIRKTLRPHIADARLVVRFNVPRNRLSDNTSHAILRILRELTTNAIRHGKAKNIRIAGGVEGHKLLFSVKDDGCGFDPNAIPGMEQGHFGLQGIRDRIDTFEGEMEISSVPGKGTKVTIRLNVPNDQEDAHA